MGESISSMEKYLLNEEATGENNNDYNRKSCHYGSFFESGTFAGLLWYIDYRGKVHGTIDNGTFWILYWR